MTSVRKKEQKDVGMTKCKVTLMWYGLATVFVDNYRTSSEHVWNSLFGREVARGSRRIEKEQMQCKWWKF